MPVYCISEYAAVADWVSALILQDCGNDVAAAARFLGGSAVVLPPRTEPSGFKPAKTRSNESIFGEDYPLPNPAPASRPLPRQQQQPAASARIRNSGLALSPPSTTASGAAWMTPAAAAAAAAAQSAAGQGMLSWQPAPAWDVGAAGPGGAAAAGLGEEAERLRREADELRRQGDVHRTARDIFLKAAQAAYQRGKHVLSMLMFHCAECCAERVLAYPAHCTGS